MGGNDDGTGYTQTARPNANNNTLSNGNKPVTDEYHYFALSGVFEVGTATAPTLTDIAITSTTGSADEYVAGDTLEFTATFSEAVTVTGTPQPNFTINDGGSTTVETRQASYVSADSSTTELVFSHTVTSADYDEDGVAAPASPIDLNGGTIVSQSSSTKVDLHHSKLADNSDHKIHIAPAGFVLDSVSVVSSPASSSNGYQTGETIRIAVTWDRNVRVITSETGTPGTPGYIGGGTPTFQIMLDSGAIYAAYSQADGDNTLHCDYEVQPDDYDQAGLTLPAFAIAGGGGVIARKEVADSIAVGVQANRETVALPGQTGHAVNVNRPKVNSVAITSTPDDASDTYTAGETIQASVTFSKTVVVVVDETNGTPRIEMELQNDGETAARIRYFDYASGTGTSTLVFEHVVQSGDSDDDGLFIGADSLGANGGTIRASNDTTAILDHTQPGTQGVFSGHKLSGGTAIAVTAAFSAASYTAIEGGTNATVTVNLSADPEREVIIPITATAANGAVAGDFSPTSPAVTIASGETSGSFTLRAANDEIDDDETVSLAFGALPTGVTAAGTQDTSSVTLTNDDTAGVTFSQQAISIREGDEAAYTAVLDSEPTGDVRIRASADRDYLDVTHSEAFNYVVFDATDWETPKVLNIATETDTNGNDETQEITHEIDNSHTDGEYRNLTLGSVTVTIIDPPVLDSATVDGNSLVLTYSENLDEDSVPGTGRFDVRLDGTDVAVDAVAISGKKVTLTLATAAGYQQVVEISYEAPNTNAIQGTDAVTVDDLTKETVTYNTPNIAPPSSSSATVNGSTLTLTYDQSLDDASVPATTAFAVTVAGSARTVSSVEISGSTVALTLASAANKDDAVTVSYTVPTSNPIQNTSGTSAVALTNEAVTYANTAASGMPEIIGVPQAGRLLSVDTSAIMDASGLPATFGYKWLKGFTAIDGATNRTYTPVAADVGSFLSVEVNFTDAGGSSEGPLSSAVTGNVIADAIDCDTGAAWCATLTVGADPTPGGHGRGYCGMDVQSTGGTCGTLYGVLSEDGFTAGGIDYTALSLRWGTGSGNKKVHLTLDQDFPPAGLGNLTL